MKLLELIKVSVILFLTLVFQPVNGESLADSPVENPAKTALELTSPIYSCMQRHDTKHPIFHGCIDWHSTVHATWALAAYTRQTGDDRYITFLKDYVDTAKIPASQSELEDFPNFEMPYGRAWFLLLAREYNELIDDRLIEMGDAVADSLLTYYRKNPPEPFSRTYNNSAWALINLFRYADYRGNETWKQSVIQLTRERFLEGSCAIADEGEGFMAVCLNWAWLVSIALPKTEFLDWWATFKTDLGPLKPIRDPETSHQFGMNFSRCWGLYGLYTVTDDPQLLDAYIQHFNTSFQNREHWDGDYRAVGHWVGQFGMHALMMPTLN